MILLNLCRARGRTRGSAGATDTFHPRAIWHNSALGLAGFGLSLVGAALDLPGELHGL